MVIPEGYKQTEIGVIPEDWECKTLSNLFVIGHGKDQKQIEDKSGKYPILATGGIIGYTNSFLWDKPSALIGRKGTINKPQYIEKPFWTIDTLFYTKIFDNVCSKYVYYLFCTIDWFSLNEASGVPSLSSNNIEKVVCAIPTLKEQQRISEALSDVDGMIASLEKLIEKKKAIKQGAMQELLTGKKRLPGFSGEWKDDVIGKMGDFYSGLSGKSKKDFDCGDACYITFLNVLLNVKIDTSMLASVDVKENEPQNAVQKGDLFFNTSSETPEEVGMCAVLDEDLKNTYLNSFCFGFRLKDDTHNPLFLSYYLNSDIGRKIMSVLAQGATRYNLSKNGFAETIVQLPTKEEQTDIASILSDMDNEIEALEQKLAKTRQLKQGMMQQLLTGKIRLV